MIVYNKEPSVRREYVDRFVGQPVKIQTRTSGRVRQGRLICVAVPALGAVADLAILEIDPDDYPRAISLASISTIEPLS